MIKYTKYRTIWLSDIHLGTPECQSDKLINFLSNTDSATLYLVGDIIDLLAMKHKIKWTKEHNTVIQKIIKKSKIYTRVIYIPGNHDEHFRQFCGMKFGNIELHLDFIHQTLSGHTILCEHGDKYDQITTHHKWMVTLGDIVYRGVQIITNQVNKFRKMQGMKYWSLSLFIKQNAKRVIRFISDYQHNVIKHGRNQNVHGILCGHIHHPEIIESNNIVYFNTGDSVESCSAIVETLDGDIQLISFMNDKIEVIKTYKF